MEIRLEMQPEAIYPDCRILRNAGKLCIRRGPVLYCAEGVDNGQYLHSFLVSPTFQWKLIENDLYGLPALDISCRKLLPLSGTLYSASRPETEEATLHLIPYNAFANRGESDMLVWLTAAH